MVSHRTRSVGKGGSAQWETWNRTFAGPGHNECQDASLALTGPGWALLAVADGAGSSKYSARGSQLAIDQVERYALAFKPAKLQDGPHPLRSWLKDLMRVVGTNWIRETEQHAGPTPDFDTTLAVVLLTPGSAEVASVGDSFVVGIGSTGKAELLVAPDRPGSLTGAEAYMLPDWQDATQYYTILDSSLRTLLLSTDGLEAFLKKKVLDSGSGFSPAFVGVHQWMSDTLGKLGTECHIDEAVVFGRDDVMKRKGDDVGIALAVR